ncbi:MAG: hypothetical protein RIC55_05080 [Pirellulaceae bacterium]
MDENPYDPPQVETHLPKEPMPTPNPNPAMELYVWSMLVICGIPILLWQLGVFGLP